MVKSELVNALTERQPHLLKRDVELAVNCILNQMIETLSLGERIEIRGFGVFNLHRRSPRLARNPKTGETLNLAASAMVHFKPGKEMKDRVNAARERYRRVT